MKLLIYGLNHAPELTGIGRFTGEMCAWLAARGHAVRIVTAPPYYPQWRVGDGYSGRRWRWERRDGCDVRRCPLYVPRRQSGGRRVAHLASFALSSLPVVLFEAATWRPDAVLTAEPTALSLPGGWLTARLGGAVAWLHVQDFEIEAAARLGLLPASLSAVAARGEAWMMGRFDAVSTVSRNMQAHLADKGVAAAATVFFPNWVDTQAITPQAITPQAITPVAGGGPLRAELGIGGDAVVALYSGNLGAKQGLETLIDAADRLRGRTDIVLVLCGDGAGRAALVDAAAGRRNVRLIPLQPPARLNALLGMADMHLLPQRAEAADLVMPSKLGGMLASGRPVIAAADPGTEIERAVGGCGLAVAPGDGAAMAAAIRELADDPAQRRVLGLAARRCAEADWDREVVLRRFESALRKRVEQRRTALASARAMH